MRKLHDIIISRNEEIDDQLAENKTPNYIFESSSPVKGALAWDAARKIDYTPELQAEVSISEEKKPEAQPKTKPAKKESGVLSVLYVNLELMRGYYTWSQQQAKIIYWVSIASCIIGLAIILAAVTLGFLKLLTLDQTVLTAIGGMITQVFAGTTLIVYQSSIKQLNYYHKSLHEDQRFLSSADLVWRLSKTERDKMLAAIIRSALRINVAVALDNESDDDDEKTGKSGASGQTNGSTVKLP
jgi:hypothetical protein